MEPKTDTNYSMTDETPIPEVDLSAKLEALLFSAPGAVTHSHLATALQVSTREVEAGLETLEAFYTNRGLRIQMHRGRVQLTTAPELAPLVEIFLGLEATSRLSQAALEALAIVAYQQPVTRPTLDSIRGVNSDSVLKNLLTKGLLQELGRAESPGRPILYGTTPEFLQHFGINRLEDLPELTLPEDKTNEQEAPENETDGGDSPDSEWTLKD
jgi:segregation and condensation protein B